MSAHVSVFDLKRFAEERLGSDELSSFEEHLSACASCAAQLQQAALRELTVRGLDPALETAAPRSVAIAIAMAASVLFALSLGQGPVHFPSYGSGAGPLEEHGSSPLILGPADGGDGSIAFFDGGPLR